MTEGPQVGRWGRLGADLVAGGTVALVGLPQCLAYALMSGLPPAYGLSTAAVAGLVAAVVGLSPHIVTGPTNTTGLLILGALGPYLGATGLLEQDGLPILATLTLLAGALRLGLAYSGGAALLRYLPESVLAGFTAGAGLLIGIMQLDEALGFSAFSGAPPPAAEASEGAASLREALASSGLASQVMTFWDRLYAGERPGAMAVTWTLVTVAVIALGKRFRPRWPVALFAILAGALLAYGLEGAGIHLPLVKDRATVPSGWPPGALPSVEFHRWIQLAVPAFAIVLLGTLELTVSARADGARPNMQREIAAQGWANIAGAFLSAFPASASLTRSALLRLGGAQSRLAAAAAAVMVVPILLFSGEAVGYIPQAGLAGVLLLTAAGMLDRQRLSRIWLVSRASRALMMTTFVGTLVLPLQYAILLGAGLGLIIHLGVSSDPRLIWLRWDGTSLTPLPVEGGATKVPPLPTEGGATKVPPLPTEGTGIFVAEVSGTLYYAAVPRFFERLEQELPRAARVLVVDLSHAHQLRFGALEGFERICDQLKSREVEVILAGVSPEFEAVLKKAKSKLVFEWADPSPGRSLARALKLKAGPESGVG